MTPNEAIGPSRLGRPSARTMLPTFAAPSGERSMAVRPEPSTLSTAMSEPGSRPAMVALSSRPSARTTVRLSSRSMTWSEVTMTPSADQTTPLAGKRRRALTRTVDAPARSTAAASASERSARTGEMVSGIGEAPRIGDSSVPRRGDAARRPGGELGTGRLGRIGVGATALARTTHVVFCVRVCAICWGVAPQTVL